VTIGSDTVSGNGTIVAVSNGPLLTVNRQNYGSAGTITFLGPDAIPGGPRAVIQGKSLTIDTSGTVALKAGVTVKAKSSSLAASNISFGDVTGAPGGFIVFNDILQLFEQGKTLTLHTLTKSINFFGNVNLSLAGSGTKIVLDSAALVASTSGTVNINADD